MTSNERLYKGLAKVVPGTYLAYVPGKAPPLPWFAYSRRKGEEFFADDSNYARLPRYRVELLFRENDPKLVGSFESALSELGTWRLSSADYLESEACYLHVYNVQLFPENQ